MTPGTAILWGGLGGGAISALGSMYGANKSGEDAIKATEMQIAWERERANNAHQWEVEDLKKAGLNPILSAGGSGATTGGISAPMPDRSGYTSAGAALADAVNTVVENKRKQAETDNIEANTLQTQANSRLTEAKILTELEKKGLVSKQTATEISKQTLNYAAAQKMDTEMKSIKQKLESEIEEIKAKIKLAKANKDVAEQKALQEEYNTKRQQLTYVIDKSEQITRILFNGVNSAANVIDAVTPL